LAFQSDAYRSQTLPVFDYTYSVPALFAQAEHGLRDNLTLAISARWDAHSEYGSQFSPRLSMLYRPNPWTIRASLGKGFYAPTPFVEETEAAGLSRLAPLSGLREEGATTASLDTGYSFGSIETSLVLFASDIKDAVRLEPLPPSEATASIRVRLTNAQGTTRMRGAEFLLRYRWEDFTITGSYVHVGSSEPDDTGGRMSVPLTPKHTAGVVTMWERHDVGRLGLEVYYTGRQSLENNPFRRTSSASDKQSESRYYCRRRRRTVAGLWTSGNQRRDLWRMEVFVFNLGGE
jgi:outer membrane receptor for ferrienterochelin and colicins